MPYINPTTGQLTYGPGEALPPYNPATGTYGPIPGGGGGSVTPPNPNPSGGWNPEDYDPQSLLGRYSPEHLEYSMATGQDFQSNSPYYSGGSGFFQGGLSPAEFAAKAKAEKLANNREEQFSQNNSFNFNPDTLNGVKSASDAFQLSLNDIMGSTWKSTGTKNDEIKALVSSSADVFAKPFKSVEEFQSAYQANPDIQKKFNSFLGAGGTISDIATKIQAKNNVQGQPIPSPYVTKGDMNTADYLSAINNVDNRPVAQRAEADLFPESQIAQNEIIRQYNIPKELQNLYFGDEKTIGFLEQKKNMAQEQKDLIERKLSSASITLQERANGEISKNNAELEIAKSTIESNRLSAKNYMTGMLAKLGALKTTGTAPLALKTLDQKYEAQKLQAEQKVNYANQGIRIEMKSKINDMESHADDLILKIKEDLSKDSETALKEIAKAQKDSQSEVYKITQKYAKDLQSQKEQYEKTMKTESEKYSKEYLRLASKYDPQTASDIITGKRTEPTNSGGQFASANDIPSDDLDTVVSAILSGLTLSQLYSRYPNISKAALNQIWNQMTNKNTGEPVKKPAVPKTKTTSEVKEDVSEISDL